MTFNQYKGVLEKLKVKPKLKLITHICNLREFDARGSQELWEDHFHNSNNYVRIM
jgi:hypothetical protein